MSVFALKGNWLAPLRYAVVGYEIQRILVKIK